MLPESVIANAHYQRGLLSFASSQWDSARGAFEASIRTMDQQVARLFLGYAIEMQGYRMQAIEAFQRVIDVDSTSTEAIEATKELTELRSITPKSKKTALVLSILLGLIGVDRFYLGDIGGGLKKLVTFGGLYVWWIVDIIRIATGTMRDGNGMRLED